MGYAVGFSGKPTLYGQIPPPRPLGALLRVRTEGSNFAVNLRCGLPFFDFAIFMGFAIFMLL